MNMTDFESWLQDLPSESSPTWIGLPESAEEELEKARSARMLETLRKLERDV
jgi:hypothetical protein